MKRGFTLVELLGVIVILGLIAIIATPPILNQIKKTGEQLSSATEKVLATSTELYMDEHSTNYPLVDGNTYCITLKTLVNYDYIKSPIINASTGEEINETENVMKVQINGQNREITFAKLSECEENRQ